MRPGKRQRNVPRLSLKNHRARNGWQGLDRSVKMGRILTTLDNELERQKEPGGPNCDVSAKGDYRWRWRTRLTPRCHQSYGALSSVSRRLLMARRPSLTSQLYRAARPSNSISAIASGSPRRVTRGAKNVLIGRSFWRAGIWRRLWQ